MNQNSCAAHAEIRFCGESAGAWKKTSGVYAWEGEKVRRGIYVCGEKGNCFYLFVSNWVMALGVFLRNCSNP